MKIALIGDIHLGVRNDSPIFKEAHNKFFEEVFIPNLLSNDITEVIILGDLFDRRKFINYVILENFKRELFDRLQFHGITVHLLVGNHDIYFKNTNRVNSPNLVLGEYDNVIVYTDPTEIKFDGESVGIVPWINPENEEASLDFIENFQGRLLFGHFELVGFEMHKNGGVSRAGLDKNIFSKYEHVFSGHYHQPSSQNAVTYLGAPMQYTWADHDCKRGFYIWDFDMRDLSFVENPDIMFHKIFYDGNTISDEFNFDVLKERVVRVFVGEKEDQHKFDLFLDNIQENNPFELDVVDNTFHEISEELDETLIQNEDTMVVVESYIDGLELTFDSDDIKSLFKELYLESLAELD